MFRRDPLIYDGSRANNGWLQETPKPITNLCWDNAVLISPNTAKKQGLVTGDIVEIDVNGRKQKGPIWPQPGHPDNSITVFLGYGRTKAGRVGNNVGFDFYQVRTSDAAWIATAKISKVGIGIRFRSSARLPVHRPFRPAEGHRAAQEPSHHSQGDAAGFHQEPRLRARRHRVARAGDDALHQLSVHRVEVGHDHRHELLHRLQDLHRGLPGGEQHSGRGQGGDDARPPDAMVAGGCVLRGRHRESHMSTTSRFRASSARTRPAKWFARSAPRCTAPKA